MVKPVGDNMNTGVSKTAGICTTVASAFVAVALAGCGGIDNIEALGDLSAFGDCELPDGYTAWLLSDLQTNSTTHECPLEGDYVIVRAVPEAMAYCTTMLCDEIEDPCCNGCDGGFWLPNTGGDSLQITLLSTDEYPVRYNATSATGRGEVCDGSCTGLACDGEHLIWGVYHCNYLGELGDQPYYVHGIQVKGACWM